MERLLSSSSSSSSFSGSSGSWRCQDSADTAENVLIETATLRAISESIEEEAKHWLIRETGFGE